MSGPKPGRAEFWIQGTNSLHRRRQDVGPGGKRSGGGEPSIIIGAGQQCLFRHAEYAGACAGLIKHILTGGETTMPQQGAIRPFGMTFLVTAVMLTITTPQAQKRYDPGASDTEIKIGNIVPGITINTGPDDFFPIEQTQLMQFDGEARRMFGEVGH
jgi:hypothetical protein